LIGVDLSTRGFNQVRCAHVLDGQLPFLNHALLIKS
jgi:hypothetical protein